MQEKVENLKPEECLILIEKMNRKRFLNRQIFVTSVVADSPIKQEYQPHKLNYCSSSKMLSNKFHKEIQGPQVFFFTY